jgi:hypothetical protein
MRDYNFLEEISSKKKLLQKKIIAEQFEEKLIIDQY